MDKTVYKKEAGKAQLVVEAPQTYPGEYQQTMLMYNEPEGFLPVSECSEGLQRKYYYDVTGHNCLADMVIFARMDGHMIARLMNDLEKALDKTCEYLLDGGRICLDPAYIYYDQKAFRFCYIPFKESDFDWEFRILTDFIAAHADPEDRAAAAMAEKLSDMASAFAVDRGKLREIASWYENDGEEVVSGQAEVLQDAEELEENETDLPWDEWQLNTKPGLFRWP